MRIRESAENDKDDIRNLHLEAFGEAEGKAVSKLAIELLEDKTAQPVLSLISEDPSKDSRIIGHIIFTAISVSDADIEAAYILAPLAVATRYQKKGVGTALIQKGMTRLKELGASFVMVLGDPKYYRRTGFHTNHLLSPPYQLDYPEAWMAQELKPGTLKKAKGAVHCCKSLSSPEHW